MLVFALFACAPALPPTMVPTDTRAYQTTDGWEGELRHYAGKGPPILLVHGMGANHYNWDYRPEVSLAWTLQAAGWDVWIPELRGDPGSRGPSKAAQNRWTFSDLATLDLPAAVDAVLTETGEKQLYWVGHSLGGMLLYTAISDYPEKIAGGVAVCSPSGFAHPLEDQKTALANRWLFAGHGSIPAVAFGQLTGGLGKSNPLFHRVAHVENLDFAVARGLAKHALVDLPNSLAREAIGWVDAGELVHEDGVPWIKPNPVPMLVLGGSDDKIVSEPDVRATCRKFPNCEYRLLGTAGGLSTEYGHVDALLGRSAQTEVYPIILDWLDQQTEK